MTNTNNYEASTSLCESYAAPELAITT